MPLFVRMMFSYVRGHLHASCRVNGCGWQADSRKCEVRPLAFQHYYSHFR